VRLSPSPQLWPPRWSKCPLLEESGPANATSFPRSHVWVLRAMKTCSQCPRRLSINLNIVEYLQTLTFAGPAFKGSTSYLMVLMGADDIEEYLQLESSSINPLRAAVAKKIIDRLETLLAKFVAS
jgi:hypothetical protein